MVVGKSKSKGKPAPALTKEELQEFRELLLAKKRDLLGDLTGMTAEARGAGSGERGGLRPELPKYADESDDREITIGLLANERVLLHEIADALERIDKGVYGVCLGAGEPIGKSRLRARPWAKYCIACARTMEQKQGRAGASLQAGLGSGNFGDDDGGGHEPQDVRTLAADDSDDDG
jgi:RNA polymerase-binding protein DksA